MRKLFLIISLFITVTCIGQRFQVDTDGTLMTGLVSYFKMDGRTDFYGSNDMTSVVGTPTYVAGKVGNATSFGGNSYFYNASPTGLPDGADDRSISLWFYCTQYPGTGADYPNFVGWGSEATSQACALGIYASDNFFSNYIGFFGYGTDVSLFVPTLNTWYHMIATYDGTTMRAYINNGTEYNLTVLLNTVLDSYGLHIGGSNSFGQLYGYVDEIGIWNKVLSAQEMTDLYNGGNGQSMFAGFNTITLSGD